jgi:predicted alpha/beta-hydrolase family hydrolase
MKDIQYFIIAGSLLLITAIGKALEKYRKKEIQNTIDVASSLIFSIIGGSIAGMIASVYIDTIQIQWILIAGGAWMGERILDAVADALESKIDIIFKRKNDE